MTIERDPDGREFTIIHSLSDIPTFANEEDEADWWDTHDFSDEVWEQLRQAPRPAWLPAVEKARPAPRAVGE